MLTEGLEKWLGHRIQAIFVFFVFCSVEVPMYIFPRKKTKFSPFLNSLPACRNLLFDFFDTLQAPLQLFKGAFCFILFFDFVLPINYSAEFLNIFVSHIRKGLCGNFASSAASAINKNKLRLIR